MHKMKMRSSQKQIQKSGSIYDAALGDDSLKFSTVVAEVHIRCWDNVNSIAVLIGKVLPIVNSTIRMCHHSKCRQISET